MRLLLVIPRNPDVENLLHQQGDEIVRKLADSKRPILDFVYSQDIVAFTAEHTAPHSEPDGEVLDS